MWTMWGQVRVYLISSVFVVVSTTSVSADGYDGSFEGSSNNERTRLQAASLSDAATSGHPLSGEAGSVEGARMENASPDDLAEAIGRYAKARSLLIAAIREFDLGYKVAKPDAILNSAEWRSDLLKRAADLERVLAPQPRVSKRTVRFEADPRLLGAEANPK